MTRIRRWRSLLLCTAWRISSLLPGFPPFVRSYCCLCWRRSAALAAKPSLAMPLEQPRKNPRVTKVHEAWLAPPCTARCILTQIAALASFPARCPRILVTVRRIRWRRPNRHVRRFPPRWLMSRIRRIPIAPFLSFAHLCEVTPLSHTLPHPFFPFFVSDFNSRFLLPFHNS